MRSMVGLHARRAAGSVSLSATVTAEVEDASSSWLCADSSNCDGEALGPSATEKSSISISALPLDTSRRTYARSLRPSGLQVLSPASAPSAMYSGLPGSLRNVICRLDDPSDRISQKSVFPFRFPPTPIDVIQTIH